MIAKKNWVLASPLEQDKMKSGIYNPDGVHKYFLEVKSIGGEVESCEVGDVIIKSSDLGWFQLNGTKLYIFKGSQVVAAAEEEDLTAGEEEGSDLDLVT